MEQHPVPRQITTFEFKLIGFMTLRQFLYLIVFIPLGYIVIRVFPIPILNFILGFLIGAWGVGLAFFPINDRPMDVFIKNLIRRLVSATQYYYRKDNSPVYFLTNVVTTDPKKISTHVEAQQKLGEYLARTGKVTQSDTTPKQQFEDVNKQQEEPILPSQQAEAPPIKQTNPPQVVVKQPESTQIPPQAVKRPFVAGVIKNNKQIPLPGILIYLKDQQDHALRLLKTNPHGIFATYNKLPPGDYTFEVKDPKGTFFFDTMKIKLQENNPSPVEIHSKEML